MSDVKSQHTGKYWMSKPVSVALMIFPNDCSVQDGW